MSDGIGQLKGDGAKAVRIPLTPDYVPLSVGSVPSPDVIEPAADGGPMEFKVNIDARAIPQGRLRELREQLEKFEKLRNELGDLSEISESLKVRVSSMAKQLNEARGKLKEIERAAFDDSGCDPTKKYVLNLDGGFFVSHEEIPGP